MSKKEKVVVKKEKRERKNIFKSIGRYFKGVGKETARIRWTSGKDLLKYSIATVVFMVFIGAYFYLIDLLVAFVRSRL